MRKVSIKELYEMASGARQSVWDMAQSAGREPKIYLHWTAGSYTACFPEYHINITGAGDIYVSTDDLSERKNHTFKRNTGSIGVALCCAYGGGSNSTVRSVYDNNNNNKGIVAAPAEIFNIGPETYLWSYQQATRYSQAFTTYQRELPVRY